MTPGPAHAVQWVSPLPLWSASAPAMQAPAVLRFGSDRFMEELQAALAARAPDVSGLVARWESFRERYPGEPDDDAARTPKLYQPAHGRFYLVAASLVCRRIGLPDHVVDPTRDERAAFVLRRQGAGGEEAWVADPADATKRVWSAVADPRVLAPGEDLLPLFPIRFTADGRGRRLLVGLVPTSSRETYESAAALAAPDAEGNPALAEARARVVEPYRALLAMQGGDTAEIRAEVDVQQREASRFLLLDLAELLKSRAPATWDVVAAPAPPSAGDPAADLYTALAGASTERPSGRSWRAALLQAWQDAAHIATGDGKSGVDDNLALGDLSPEVLDRALAKATVGLAAPAPAPAPAAALPKLDPRGQATYVLHCVFRRPRCGPLRPDVVSAASAPFTIAPFFDADAPARPVRIVLPDPGVASLRRFKKNVGMVTSAALRKQMARIGLKDALDGKFAAAGGGLELDEICTFSIPIITLCAFIVLMIFLVLLNLVFWWLPFLKICFPLVKKE